MRVLLSLALMGCMLLSACDCGDDAQPAIEVVAVDSVTGLPVTSIVSATARDGSFTETFLVNGPELRVAFGRPGTYRVEIQADGYAPWSQEGLRADAIDCGLVETVHVVAQLVPLATS